ncbi:MAG: hypothetical protein Tsb002_29800 [Wenzhouxiangellaceae bacterium]
MPTAQPVNKPDDKSQTASLFNACAYFAFFHILIWLLYGAGYYADVMRWNKADDYWQVVVLVTISASLLSIALDMVYRRTITWPLIRKSLLIIVSVGIAAALWSTAKYAVLFEIYAPQTRPESPWRFLGLNLLAGLNLFFIWSLLYFFYHHYQQAQRNRIAALQAENLARDNQLKLLSYQLNPHFLFNSLNAIATLTLKRDHDGAHQAIVGLAQLLRDSLERQPWKLHSLEREINSLQRLIRIYQIRFPQRLQFVQHIDDSALQASLPAMLLQPLLENAIQHSIDNSAESVSIELQAQRQRQTLIIRICNTLPQSEPASTAAEPHHGLGLDNVRQRLRAYYGDQAELQIQHQPQQFTVTLSLPWQRTAA